MPRETSSMYAKAFTLSLSNSSLKRFIPGRKARQNIAGPMGSPCWTSLEQGIILVSPKSTRKNTFAGPCCDATDVGTRHARICPRAGAQVKSPPAPPSCDLPHSQEAWGPSSSRERGKITEDRNLRMDIVVRRGVFGTPQTRHIGTNSF